MRFAPLLTEGQSAFNISKTLTFKYLHKRKMLNVFAQRLESGISRLCLNGKKEQGLQ